MVELFTVSNFSYNLFHKHTVYGFFIRATQCSANTNDDRYSSEAERILTQKLQANKFKF